MSDISGSHSSLTGSEAITEVATIVSQDRNRQRPLGQPGIPGTEDLDNTVHERTEKYDNHQQKVMNPNDSFIITEIEIDETTRHRARTRARTIDSQYLTEARLEKMESEKMVVGVEKFEIEENEKSAKDLVSKSWKIIAIFVFVVLVASLFTISVLIFMLKR